MEAVPDFSSMSDRELRDEIRKLVEKERQISYERRLLHGRIDILKAELQARLQRKVGEGRSPLEDIDMDELAEILASRATPPLRLDDEERR